MEKADKRPFFRRADFLIIVAILVVCLVVIVIQWLGKTPLQIAKADVYKDGEIVMNIDLNKPAEIPFGNVKFLVKDNKIKFLESDCPDKLCVNTGFIEHANDIAVCLPNKIYIKIEDNKIGVDSDYDLIAE